MAEEEASADFIVFVAADGLPAARVGAEQDFGKVADFFTRRKEDLEAEWSKIVVQMQELLQHLTMTIQSFELSEVQFELGFSAEGHLGFIAKAGANGTVRVTFARKVAA